MHKSMDCAVVVIGGGASGLCAAIAAAEAGAGPVVLLEKSEALGGKGGSAQGMYALGSRLQRQEGVCCDPEYEFRDIMHMTSYLCDGVLLRQFLAESGRTVDWLLDHGIGIELTDRVQQLSHGASGRVYHRWNRVKDRFQTLRRSAERAGVRILMGADASELLTEGRRVTGVRARIGEDVLTLRAGAVILGSGGFAGNMEMLRENLADVLQEPPLFFPTRSTGEGVRMAWSVGAGKASERAVLAHGVAPAYPQFSMHKTQTSTALMNIPILWVNDRAERFCSEEIIYDSQFFSNACMAQGGVAYAAVDRGTVEQFMHAIPYEMQFWDIYGMDGGYFPAPIADFDREIRQLIRDGVAVEAKDAGDLAAQMGWDPETLRDTLLRYNHWTEVGRDEDFYKSPKYLRYPVREGPLYLLKGKVMIMGTLGGVRIDRRFRALRPDRSPIEGLYAAGGDAGGIYHGYSYLSKEGFALGWALTSGRLAGANAAAFLCSADNCRAK